MGSIWYVSVIIMAAAMAELTRLFGFARPSAGNLVLLRGISVLDQLANNNSDESTALHLVEATSGHLAVTIHQGMAALLLRCWLAA